MHRQAFTYLIRMLGWPAHRPAITVTVALALVALAAVSTARLTPISSLAPMFARDDPASRAMARVLSDFSTVDRLLLLVQTPAGASATKPVDDAAVDAESSRIAQLHAFADRLETVIQRDPEASSMIAGYASKPGEIARPFVRKVMTPNCLYYLSRRQFEALQMRLSPANIHEQIQKNEALMSAASPAADAISRRVLRDPLRLYEVLRPALQPGSGQGGSNAQRDFVSSDGRSLLIRATGAEPAGDLAFTRRLMPIVRRCVRRAEPGDLTVRYAGAYPAAALSARVTRADMQRSVIISIVLLQVLFLLMYRGLWTFAVTFAPVAAGIVCGFGVFALYRARLTPVTAAAGAILAGLGIDYAIHYLSRYQHQRRAGGAARRSALANIHLAPTLLAACVTSLIGFLAIGASSVPALRDFAWIGALGLGGAFLATLGLLPGLLVLVDRRGGQATGPARRGFEPMMHRVRRHGRPCIGGCLLVLIAAATWLFLGPGVSFNADMGVMQPRPNPPMQTQDRIEARFPQMGQTMPIHLNAASPRELLITAHRVQQAVQTPPLQRRGVSAPLSLATLLPDPRTIDRKRARLQQLDVQRILNDFQEAIRQSMFRLDAYRGYIGSLKSLLRPGEPPGLKALASYPALGRTLLPRSAIASTAAAGVASQSHDVAGASEEVAPRQALTLVRLPARTERADQADRSIASRAVQRQLQPIAGAAPTGMTLVADDVQRTIRTQLPMLFVIAGGAVLVWLLIVFRSVKQVALALLPAAFALAILAAIMSLAGVEVNLINMIALPMLAGIAVDDGIFLVRLARCGRRPAAAVIGELASSCHAITMTSLTTTLAFGSLLLTRTPAIQSLGLVLAIGMIGAWVGSVLLLAPVLMRRRGA